MTLTPHELQNWAFAIFVSLMFVSCGVHALADAVGSLRAASHCGKAEP